MEVVSGARSARFVAAPLVLAPPLATFGRTIAFRDNGVSTRWGDMLTRLHTTVSVDISSTRVIMHTIALGAAGFLWPPPRRIVSRCFDADTDIGIVSPNVVWGC